MRRTAIAACLLLAAALPAQGIAQTGAAPPPAAAAGCHSRESRQFDFWVGRWSVAKASAPGTPTASSLIEKLYAGCAIRENWMPLTGGGDGGSLNSYDETDRKWKQTWIDASGARAEFVGGWNGKAMVLEGIWPQPGHPRQRTRMTYTPRADGSVEQAGESSDDDGKTWQPSFDLIYRRAKS